MKRERNKRIHTFFKFFKSLMFILVVSESPQALCFGWVQSFLSQRGRMWGTMVITWLGLLDVWSWEYCSPGGHRSCIPGILGLRGATGESLPVPAAGRHRKVIVCATAWWQQWLMATAAARRVMHRDLGGGGLNSSSKYIVKFSGKALSVSSGKIKVSLASRCHHA